jgi:signal transduction histidine kinase
VQRYVENFTEQLRSTNAKLLKANESLSRIDESRLQLIRTVSHELANVLNTLRLTITLVTTGNDEAIRSEMLDTCQRNVQEMSDLLNDLKDYSVLIRRSRLLSNRGDQRQGGRSEASSKPPSTQ